MGSSFFLPRAGKQGHPVHNPVEINLATYISVLSYNSLVFISADDANSVIKRQRRASSLLLEEVLQGSLERECLEERCTHEEAREVFENDEMLVSGRRCSSSPCQHNGVCEDSIRGYTCTCAEGYEGENCAFALKSCQCTIRFPLPQRF
uniref:Protein Z, vitamin K dependent plasma glycoprotein n=1 Tax=Cyanistes caeruleus TaxID=156563 RepID=A0A8C0U1V8_CYACU